MNVIPLWITLQQDMKRGGSGDNVTLDSETGANHLHLAPIRSPTLPPKVRNKTKEKWLSTH